MNKKVGIILILLLAAGCLLSAARADKLTSGDYTLYDAVNSGGGTLNSGDYTLKDAKGDAVGGKLTSGDYILTPGLLGLMGGAGTWEPIYISRSGSSIIVTWEAGKTLDLYCLTGDGTGSFTNDTTKWALLSSGGGTSGGTSYSISGNTLTHTGQVGAGTSEAYYRGLSAGASPTMSVGGVPLLAQAPAAGKVNINCKIGFNLISLPFKYNTGGDSLANVFGNQLTAMDSPITADEIYYKPNPASWGMTNVFQKTDGSWYLSSAPATPATNTISRESAYLISIKSTDKIITAVGNVATDNQLLVLGTGFNAFGLVYPVNKKLDDLGLASISKVTASDTPITADEIYFKNNPASWGMTNVFLKTDGKWYLSASPTTPATFNLSLPYGYYYSIKTPSTTINWLRSFP